MTEVREFVSTEGLAEKVRLHGWVDSSEVEAAMSRSDVLLMSSSSEGFPVVGVQPLAHGLAIVGTRIDGLRDLVDDGANGYLCPLDDQGSFVERLRTLITPALLTAMKIRSRTMARTFDLDAIVERYEALFRAVVAKRRNTDAPSKK